MNGATKLRGGGAAAGEGVRAASYWVQQWQSRKFMTSSYAAGWQGHSQEQELEPELANCSRY